MDPNAGGKPDYLDKAFNMGAKKFGGAQGQKIAGNRGMSEKIVSFALFVVNEVLSLLHGSESGREDVKTVWRLRLRELKVYMIGKRLMCCFV